ncbi:MAG: hypothetical protein ABI977_00100 [Acidobacteriota bacterium]
MRTGTSLPNPRTSIKAVVSLAFACLVIVWAISLLDAPPAVQSQGTGGEVHGFIFASAGTDDRPNNQVRIFLPDIEVFVKNTGTGVDSATVKTDIKGRFVIPRQTPGRYQLCFKAPGYEAGCSNEPITITSLTVFPQPAAITPRPGYVFGRVTMKDNRSPHQVDPFFKIDVQTQVRALDSAGVAAGIAARANNQGFYLIPEVPSGAARLIARSEVTTVTGAVSVAAARTARVDLTLPNTNPVITTVIASDASGNGVRKAATGDAVTVRVQASDADGDALHYSWAPSARSGAFSTVDAPTVSWKLPTFGGLHTMYVAVTDRKGGYSIGKVDVSTSSKQVSFSGKVSGTDVPAVDGATVTINGRQTRTTRTGYFFLQLPSESGRYVMSINKPGYQLLSRVSQEAVLDGKYQLVRAQRFTVNPRGAIKVTEERSAGINRPGASVTIPANSLVDSRGRAATGSLSLFISTFNLTDPAGRSPGDYAGTGRTGRNLILTSYGMVDIQIVDGRNQPINLAPGRTAEVSLPVEPRQLNNLARRPPNSIPIWFYDQIAGQWKEEGTATLAGNYYVTKVRHFSVINADVTFNDAACLRLVADTTKLRLPFDVRLTIPTGTGVDKVITKTMSDALSVVVRLPPSTPITIDVLDSNGNPIATARQIVTTGPANIGVPELNPPYPYVMCTAEVVLTLGLPADGGFLDFSSVGLSTEAEATAYYAAIDPTNAKDTLTKWKNENGFASGDEASAIYFNEGDLGFGRSMHVQEVGSNRAFYVSNYPTVDEARLDVNLIATVAMEYSPHPSGGARYTKFYVFDAGGNRLKSADLDGRGQKFIPKLCIICHGGDNASMTSTGDVEARFIPFDLASYRYTEVEIPPLSGTKPFSREAQEAQFRILNQRVLDTNFTSAIQELVQGWYGGPGLPNPTQNSLFVPAGWVAKSSVYTDVVAQSCRACHTTRDAPLDWAQFDGPNSFDGFKEFGGSIKYRVCDSKEMPQARRTYLNFWLSISPHRPAMLANAGLNGWLPTDTCPEP